jgi:flagellar protein FlaF
MPVNPLDAYRNIEKVTLPQRDLEATVLSKAAMQLQSIRDNWAAEDCAVQLESALSYNQKVWSFFQAELSMEDNPLPDDIKGNLLALSMFVDRRTFDTLAYPAPEKLGILIDINLNVSAGLRGELG